MPGSGDRAQRGVARAASTSLATGIELTPAEPLWKRVPTRGDDGRPLSDFMMLIPRLKVLSKTEVLHIVESIQGVLERYAHAVVFADLNPKLNVLWVSVRPIPGIVLELATAIHCAVPQSRLVAQKLSE